MNNYLLLIGISCVPAVTGMCITLPLWLLRHLRNQTIHTLGLTVLFLTLASCLLPVITGENSGQIGRRRFSGKRKQLFNR